MPSATEAIAIERIRTSGPLTVADLMELALYHPQTGYYSRASRRSGRSGDFFTSVDVGPLFGETIAVQLAEMADALALADTGRTEFHLVEAGASDGRLAADILSAIDREYPALSPRMRVTLVERCEAARRAHTSLCGDRLVSTGVMPRGVTGVILAHELLDALPVHSVVMTEDGLREVYVAERDGLLSEILGPLSDPMLAPLDVALPIGQRVEISPAVVRWVREAAEALDIGFILIFDYGDRAANLHSAPRASGTLMTYQAHTAGSRYLQAAGESDVTAMVDFTALTRAAVDAGLAPIGAVDQTYFLCGLGITDRLGSGSTRSEIARRLAARTLLMPGGLGSTIKVLAFSKGLPPLRLRGFSSGRLT